MNQIILLLSIILTCTNAFCVQPYIGLSCDDLKMYEQCEHAQKQIDEYTKYIININNTYELLSHIPQLNCHKHLTCSILETYYAYCQNMDSYVLCVSADNLLESFINRSTSYVHIPETLLNNKPTFECDYDISVYSYYPNDGDIYNYYEANDKSFGCKIQITMVYVLFCVALLAF